MGVLAINRRADILAKLHVLGMKLRDFLISLDRQHASHAHGVTLAPRAERATQLVTAKTIAKIVRHAPTKPENVMA